MNKFIAFTAHKIFDGYQTHLDSTLIVQGNTVVGVTEQNNLSSNHEIIPLGDGIIAPGFVDLQVNGGGGTLFNNDPSVSAIKTICDSHARIGTTSLLPTLITDTSEVMSKAIQAGQEALKLEVDGMIGLHLEGPHLSRESAGAHPPSQIRPMEEDDCKTLEKIAKDFPCLKITVSPDAITTEQIYRLRNAGVVLSLGHTNCTFDKAKKAVKAGVSCVTHLFNAMSNLEKREPGLVGAALGLQELSAGLIADGVHVHTETIKTALRAKLGPGFIFLVSDSMATTGSDIKQFPLYGRTIYKRDGKLTLEDGTLAGADLDLGSAVRFLVENVGVGIERAFQMATLYPAKLIGKEGEIGCLKQGSRADFSFLDDNLRVQKVWRGGNLFLG